MDGTHGWVPIHGVMTIFACDMRHRKSIDHIHQVRGGFSPSGEPLLSRVMPEVVQPSRLMDITGHGRHRAAPAARRGTLTSSAVLLIATLEILRRGAGEASWAGRDEALSFWDWTLLWSLLLRFGAAMVPDVMSMVSLVALGEALPYRWVVLILGVSVRGSGRVMEDGSLAA